MTVRQASKLLDKHTARLEVDYRKLLTHKFRVTQTMRLNKHHSHQQAAELRGTVAMCFEDLILGAGYYPYSVSTAARDHYDGMRHYYSVKDYSQPVRDDPITENHVIVMVDTDYYTDINRYLSYGRPIIIYTFAPQKVADEVLDGRFMIKDDVVHYDVSGGGSYQHQVWNYDIDVCTGETRNGSVIYYKVETYQLDKDKHRRVVFITPECTIASPYCGLAQAKPIERVKYTVGGVANCLHDVSTNTYSIAANGSYDAVTLSGAVWSGLKIRKANAKEFNISAVERLLRRDENMEDTAVTAAVLYPLLDVVAQARTLKTATITTKPVTYQAPGPLRTEDGKEYGRTFAPSLVTSPCMFPRDSYNNEVVSVAERIHKVRNDKPIPKELLDLCDEFVCKLVPIPSIGQPLELQDVIDVQQRPTQRSRNETAKAYLASTYRNILRTMLKKETYPSAAAPRAITTHETTHQLFLGALVKAFKESVLKDQDWYAPGKSPAWQHDRLAEICENGAVLGDFNKFDGSISEDIEKYIVRAAIMRWTDEANKQHAYDVLRKEDPRYATTSKGVVYEPGFSRKSGSPLTTDGNTPINAAVTYIALRQLGFDCKKAWKNLGLYAGDDSVNRNIPGLDAMLVAVCDQLGLSMRSEVRARGEDIDFLGRHLADPTTQRTSIQDVKRTLPKLHMTASPVLDIRVAAVNRVTGYLVTDRHTPIIGVWCKKVKELMAVDSDEEKMTHEEAHRLNNSWPQDPVEAVSLFFRATDFTPDEVLAIETAILAARTLEELPHAVIDSDRWKPHKIAAVIGDEIVGPQEDSETNEQIASKSKSKSKKRCKKQQHASKKPTSRDEPIESQSCPPTTSVTSSGPTTAGQSARPKRSSTGSSKPSTNNSATAPATSSRRPMQETSSERLVTLSGRSGAVADSQKNKKPSRQSKLTPSQKDVPQQQQQQARQAGTNAAQASAEPTPQTAKKRQRKRRRTTNRRGSGHNHPDQPPNRTNPDKRV
jgi:hypothetical protein